MSGLSANQHRTLLQQALSVKQRFLAMYKSVNAGHVGCSLSCAEILTFLRMYQMKESDHLLLSKGHAAAALYSVLAEAKVISDEAIQTFYRNNTYLAAHPPTNKLKGIPFATGSLGHGLSLAAGLGLASKLKSLGKNVYCVTSDGEIDEGATWEAALFIAHHQLTNVFWLIDRNQLQGYGRTEQVMKLEPLDQKLEAFGFQVKQCDGHDFNAIHEALQFADGKKPLAVICNTRKGRGWAEYEDQLDSHYLPMKDVHYEAIGKAIQNDFETALQKIPTV
ncbi:MAG: 1-deoxy-D-xylulose-5-phosphate synthase N-terminal domain-containing protein [Chitinophagales bacterium]